MISYRLSCLLGAVALACHGRHCDASCVDARCFVPEERSIQVAVCDRGFDYDVDTGDCVAEEEYTPQMMCEYGENRAGRCVVSSPAFPSCPKTFSLEGSECVRSGKSTMSTKCGRHQTPDGYGCLERSPVALEYTCEAPGYIYQGECVCNQTFQHRFHCAAGWKLEGDRCVSQEYIDCTHDFLPSDCKEECYVDPTCAGGECYFKDRKVVENRIREKAVGRKLKAGLDMCHIKPCKVKRLTPRPAAESVELVSKTCVKRLEVDADIYCEGPSEAVFNGEECCIRRPMPKVPTCAAEGDVEDCYEMKRVPALVSCPPGFQKNCWGNNPNSCECVNLERRPANLTCPPGAQPEGDRCVEVQVPVAYCPEKDSRLEGEKCVRVLREPVRLHTTVVARCVQDHCEEKEEEERCTFGDKCRRKTQKRTCRAMRRAAKRSRKCRRKGTHRARQSELGDCTILDL
ncbi:MAG: hypothetical protein KVP17_004688 [Porospora cf. gigantea B]|uniref:uncharacterized protein n=1 Tax=Porospora cf. gigantea B TaxID=2853592 RepID=UPI003571A125|nr:MAG: hypothetical protein KVP17_004688 [Porospora cf. gigantea B]